jgi:hypothetical protein
LRKQLGEIARPAQVPPLTESQALYILEKLVDHFQHQAPGAKRSSLGIEGRESGRDQVSVDEDGMAASYGRNSVAKVVFPAPFGPAMMTIFFLGVSFVI